jgi:hypothetical protein
MSLRTRRSVNEQGPSLRTITLVLALLTLGVVASLMWLAGALYQRLFHDAGMTNQPKARPDTLVCQLAARLPPWTKMSGEKCRSSARGRS